MAKYRIHCPTCQASLTVRSDRFVGQIHACPKCGSMVLVTPPDPPSHGSESETEDSRQQRRSRKSHAAPPAHATESAFTGSSSEIIFEEAVRLVEDSPSAEHVVAEEAPATNQEDSAKAPTGADEDEDRSESAAGTDSRKPATLAAMLLPNAEWASPAERLWRGWAVYGVAAAVGVVLAVGVCGLFIVLAMKDNESDLADQSSRPPRQEIETQEVETDAGGPDLGAGGPPVESARPDVNPTNPETESAGTNVPEPRNSVADPQAPTAPVDEIPDHVEPPIEPTDPGPGSDGPGPSARIPDAPLAVLSTEQPLRPHPRPRKIDVFSRLADPIVSIEFEDIPLTDFLHDMCDLSTIPLTIPPDVLTQVGHNPDTLVSVRQADTNVEKVLDEVLGSLGLAFTVDDGHVVVVKRFSGQGKVRSIMYPMSDLGGDDPETLTEWARLLRVLVDPGSWQDGGGPARVEPDGDALRIEQSNEAHFQIITLFEKLRVARGLRTRSRYDQSLFVLDARWAKSRPALSRQVSLTFVQPMRMTRILDRISDAGGIHILVDWQRLGEIGWMPDVTATLSVDDVSVGQALLQMLQPMELTIRAVDAATVQVTTTRAWQRQQELEFYPVYDLVESGGPDQLVERIESALGGDLFRSGGGVVHLDRASGHLIVRLSQYHQRRLATLLAEWE